MVSHFMRDLVALFSHGSFCPIGTKLFKFKLNHSWSLPSTFNGRSTQLILNAAISKNHYLGLWRGNDFYSHKFFNSFAYEDSVKEECSMYI